MMLETILKNSYKNFFIKNKHFFFKESAVIPPIKMNLLFTNSGMNQFSNFLSQKRFSIASCLATFQTCVRLGGKHNDLNTIGLDQTHHTLFTMLGNWSFNSYFKKYSILLSSRYIYSVLKIPAYRIHFCIYDPLNEMFNKPPFKFFDYESFFYLINILLVNKLDPHAFLCSGNRFDNFWQMGSAGPCGHCTEIYYNGSNAIIKTNYLLEIWNLVFIKFFINSITKKITVLKKFFVDTGLGFERLVAVFNSTLFLKKFSKLTYSSYRSIKFIGFAHFFKINSGVNIIPSYQIRVIYDHLNTILVLLKNNIFISNSGRGFIIKKLLRRVIFYMISSKMNFQKIELFLEYYLTEIRNFKLKKIIIRNFYKEYTNILNIQENSIEILRKLFLKKSKLKLTNLLNFAYQTYGLKLKIFKVFVNSKNRFINWNLFFF